MLRQFSHCFSRILLDGKAVPSMLQSPVLKQLTSQFSSFVPKPKMMSPPQISLISGLFKQSGNSLISGNLVSPNIQQTRNVIKLSFQKGKRKTVQAVLKRFYRLQWGIWIRTIAGRHKRIWKKRSRRRFRVNRHVFCNATQSFMLDKMVSKYWRKPKYYVEDIYEPYHSREEFEITRRKPWRPLEELR